MEKWIFSSTVRQVETVGMSRLQQDLSGSPHHTKFNVVALNNPPQMLSRLMIKGRIPHVCIVGAGVAGLRCADILLQHGIKVTILEGRSRIGGRLCQSKVDGHLVDLGANWIHGSNNNPIQDLSESTRTATHSWDGRQAIFDPSGKPIPNAKAAALSERIWEVIGEAMAESNKSCSKIPADKSLWDYFEEESKKLGDDAETFLHLSEMWGAFVGSPVQRQSLKFFWLEECIDGENLFVAETYHKVLERISAPALKDANVIFNKRVTRLVSKTRESSDKESSVLVETSDNDTLEFDQVVLTAPLGWLKRNKDVFNPSLPSRLVEAIDSISYGTLDKVYISFKSAWWDKPTKQFDRHPTTPSALSSQETPNVTSTTAPLHQADGKSDGPPEHFPGFMQWTPPSFSLDTNPERWSQECVNLASLPKGHAHPTLLFYTFGPTSLHLANIAREAKSPQANRESLVAFFRPYYSLLPNFSSTDADCIPTDLLHTNWASDDLAGNGSYCNFQVGLEKGDEDIEIMREGLPDRGIWLAGEHTAPFVALGTVTGAYWAGEGVARRIIRAYGGEDTK